MLSIINYIFKLKQYLLFLYNPETSKFKCNIVCYIVQQSIGCWCVIVGLQTIVDEIGLQVEKRWSIALIYWKQVIVQYACIG